VPPGTASSSTADPAAGRDSASPSRPVEEPTVIPPLTYSVFNCSATRKKFRAPADKRRFWPAGIFADASRTVFRSTFFWATVCAGALVQRASSQPVQRKQMKTIVSLRASHIRPWFVTRRLSPGQWC
jgi:hypothetical protein